MVLIDTAQGLENRLPLTVEPEHGPDDLKGLLWDLEFIDLFLEIVCP